MIKVILDINKFIESVISFFKKNESKKKRKKELINEAYTLIKNLRKWSAYLSQAVTHAYFLKETGKTLQHNNKASESLEEKDIDRLAFILKFEFDIDGDVLAKLAEVKDKMDFGFKLVLRVFTKPFAPNNSLDPLIEQYGQGDPIKAASLYQTFYKDQIEELITALEGVLNGLNKKIK